MKALVTGYLCVNAREAVKEFTLIFLPTVLLCSCCNELPSLGLPPRKRACHDLSGKENEENEMLSATSPPFRPGLHDCTLVLLVSYVVLELAYLAYCVSCVSVFLLENGDLGSPVFVGVTTALWVQRLSR